MRDRPAHDLDSHHLRLQSSEMATTHKIGDVSEVAAGFNFDILDKKKSGKRYWTTDEVSKDEFLAIIAIFEVCFLISGPI